MAELSKWSGVMKACLENWLKYLCSDVGKACVVDGTFYVTILTYFCYDWVAVLVTWQVDSIENGVSAKQKAVFLLVVCKPG